MAKKRKQTLGRGTPMTHDFQVEFVEGAIIIDDEDSAVEAAERMEEAVNAIAPVLDFIKRSRDALTDYSVTHAVDVIQCDGFYWRKIQRENEFWVATDDDLPADAPKGSTSLESIARNVTVEVKGKQKPLWPLITKRVLDSKKLEKAVARGWIPEKVVAKARLSKLQNPFIQRYDGEAEK